MHANGLEPPSSADSLFYGPLLRVYRTRGVVEVPEGSQVRHGTVAVSRFRTRQRDAVAITPTGTPGGFAIADSTTDSHRG
jgi:hypothetical protein